MSFQGGDGKWYYPGSNEPYASKEAADYYGHTDASPGSTNSSYHFETTDPVSGVTTTGYGTKVKQTDSKGRPLSDYGLDPVTGTISSEKLERLKTGYLDTQSRNLGDQIDISERKRKTEYTPQEIDFFGIRSIGVGSGKRIVSTFSQRKAKLQKELDQRALERLDYVGGKSMFKDLYGFTNPKFPMGQKEVNKRDKTIMDNTFQFVNDFGKVDKFSVNHKMDISIFKGPNASRRRARFGYDLGLPERFDFFF